MSLWDCKFDLFTQEENFMFWNNPISYEAPVYRPPSEAESLLLQVTIGCSHNGCTFCGMYQSKKFRIKKLEVIKDEILKIKKSYDKMGMAPRKIFLCDGDALSAPFELLYEVAKSLKESFFNLKRIGVYATAQNVLEKKEEELKKLSELDMDIAYLGLESGSDKVLKLINKENNQAEMISACDKLKRCGWKTSVIIMLGLGGKELTSNHCVETSKMIGQIAPNFFSFLTTTPIPGTTYFKQIEKKEITPLTIKELLQEMKAIVDSIDTCGRGKIIFRANHVSNQFPLAGILPKDKDSLVSLMSNWIDLCPDGTYPDTDPTSL